ncbi:MLO-like protein 8 [Citrus sinensis]|uniref:MLO-like protein 8 n=1 Tax=Citrus sinensis TaxID=2711 RepID=A0ACB8IYB9_CITSI|nr:MLO-like protein 8 [Citrus sinensis]
MLPLYYWCVFLVGLGAAAGSGTGSSSTERELNQTPTWAVAGVCTVIILISILLEKSLHKLGTWFTERHKRALFEALEKIKAELMVLGFISLILTFGQSYISKICIPSKVADTMLPCKADGKHDASDTSGDEHEHRRRLLWFQHRYLAAAGTSTECKKGSEPLITVEALHQLHILIFFLAVFHVLYSAITMMLGRLKIRGWKKWEEETSTHDYEFSNDPSRFRLTHETSFVRAHTSFWTRIPFFFYVGCFFRQFFRSVSRADYLTLRNGFINVHLAPGSKFNFQKYIKRSLEDDFKIVVGVSETAFQIILAIGTELQSILTKMALEISERHAVVQGIPLVQGSDQYFWFGRPQLVLHLIHFALFQVLNCLFFVLISDLRVGVLFLCSYITLPLYALVTQMGSQMKKSIFDEQTSKALKRWHMAVKKRKKRGKSSTRTLGESASPSPSTVYSSGGHTLHRFKTTGHSTRSYTYEDRDLSDYEADPLSPRSSTSNLIINMDPDDDGVAEVSEAHHGDETSNGDDFSFVKPASAKEP